MQVKGEVLGAHCGIARLDQGLCPQSVGDDPGGEPAHLRIIVQVGIRLTGELGLGMGAVRGGRVGRHTRNGHQQVIPNAIAQGAKRTLHHR